MAYGVVYDACSSAHLEHGFVCDIDICERGMESRLDGQVRLAETEYDEANQMRTGSNRLMTLKLSKQALICVTVLL